MRDDICLLLTSTIEVRNKSLVKRNDTQVRLNDYKITLKRWLTRQKGLSRIVFVDNSGYSLEELRAIISAHKPTDKQVEFLSFSSEIGNLDRSSGELETIEFALKDSKALKTCTYFAKVTGRLFITNIDKIIENLPHYFHVVSNFSNNLAYMDTTIVFFQKDFYKKKIAEYTKANVSDRNRSYIERVYAKAVHLAIEQDYRWFPLSCEPVIRGISGTKNKSYRRGRLRSLIVTLCSKLYHKFYRNSYSKNRKHLLEKWDILPQQKIKNSKNHASKPKN